MAHDFENIDNIEGGLKGSLLEHRLSLEAVYFYMVEDGVVLTTRPAKSAAKYRKVWTPDGSPLAVHSARQRTLLLGYLGQRMKKAGLPADFCPVELGMRYGNPSIDLALRKLRAANVERMDLRPLDVNEQRQQITGILGRRVDRELAGRIHARSGGNPFYAEELLAGELQSAATALARRANNDRWRNGRSAT